MEQIFARLRQKAQEIGSRFPLPDFYLQYPEENSLSAQLFESDPLLAEIKNIVETHLENDFGHGMRHAVKVTLDAGALMLIEGGAVGYTKPYLQRRVLLVQSAGLMHDIKRKQKEHAINGARKARKLMQGFSFSPDEVDDICNAIRNHEAFKKTGAIRAPEGALLSDCLYDADKFRWGPDNFTDTLWDMIAFSKPTPAEFMRHYPKGMKGIERIKDTFRTVTGKKYGPQFIEIGLAIGEELYRILQAEFVSAP